MKDQRPRFSPLFTCGEFVINAMVVYLTETYTIFQFRTNFK